MLQERREQDVHWTLKLGATLPWIGLLCFEVVAFFSLRIRESLVDVLLGYVVLFCYLLGILGFVTATILALAKGEKRWPWLVVALAGAVASWTGYLWAARH